jgi:FkbM family methyltransferase
MLMAQELARRLRSLEIIDDLQSLSSLGFPVESPVNENQRLMLETYRYQARIGEFDHLRQFLDPGAIAVDVGANNGQYALKLAAECRKCVAVEPIQELAWLAEALPRNCLFFNVAAGAAEGVGTLAIPIQEGQKQLPLASMSDVFGDAEVFEQETPIRSLDNILHECCPDERVGFIKIDVEGFEEAVLKGARETLARWRPNLQVEIWSEFVPSRKAMMAELGYSGLFFFDSHIYAIDQYDSAVHNAPQNAWRAEAPEEYDPNCYVNNFFFIPI